MAKVGWLHISDLHIPQHSDDAPIAELFNQERVRDRFLDFLTKRFPEDQIERPHYVVVTGDLAFKGKKEDYDDAGKYCVKNLIDSVAQAMNIQAEEYSERVFPVAGNHDVDRELLIDKDTEFANLATAGDLNELNDLFLNDKKKDRKNAVLARLKAYCDFVRALWRRPAATDEEILWYTRQVPIDGSTKHLHIVGLNSAWLCHSHWRVNMKGTLEEKKEEPCGHLLMCEPMVERYLKTVGKDDLVVALMHHDYARTRDETTYVKTLLQSRCDFLLSGHEHDETWVEPTLGRAHKVRAGSFYLRRDRRNAVNMVEVDVDTGQVRMLTVHYRTDKSGFWVVDRDYDPTEGNGGGGYHFDERTGLLTFSLARLQPKGPLPPPVPIRTIAEPPPAPGDRGRLPARNDALDKTLVDTLETVRFNLSMKARELREGLERIYELAALANSHRDDSLESTAKRTDNLIELHGRIWRLPEQVIRLLSLPDLHEWCTYLNLFATQDISGPAKLLGLALQSFLGNYGDPEQFDDSMRPENLFTILSVITYNGRLIAEEIASTGKVKMRDCHTVLSEAAAKARKPAPGRIPGVRRKKPSGGVGDDAQAQEGRKP